jgi:copper(I)-binding protein
MQATGSRRGGAAAHIVPRTRRAAGMLAACLAAALLLCLTSCAARAAASPAIELGTAYVPVPVPKSPGTTVAYLVIRNNGAADRLLSARTSAGGQVAFRAPAGPGVLVMHTVPFIAIPAHATLALAPNGFHLLITGAGPLHGGGAITLTLVFAHAGPVSVAATVTNPATGGNFYLFN